MSPNCRSFAHEVLAALGPMEVTACVTRIPVMWLTVLLAALTARWAAQAWGRRTGLLALWLFAFEPNLIAHGQLNTTDLGVTAFGFAGAYLLARYLRHPTTGLYVGSGLALGAAIASKTSGFFWIGVYALVILIYAVRERPYRLGRWLLRLIGMLLISLLFLWLCYGFELAPLTPGGLPVPAASHWRGLAYQRVNITAGQLTFLSGQLRSGGHWTYFPLTLLLKTPVLLLLGLVLAYWVTLRRGPGPRWSAAALFIPQGTYLAFSMLVGLNIGYRHLLPIVPYMLVSVARLVPEAAHFLASGSLWRRLSLALLAVGYIGGGVRTFPHYLAYFNVLAGGADGGYRYLADSSLEWGQGFYALKDYLQAQPVAGSKPVRLAAFSSLDPAWYGLAFEPIPPTAHDPITLTARFNPAPGRYVISVMPLQGLWLLDPDTYDWFRHQTPRAKIAHTLFVYDVLTDPAPLQRVIQCAAPSPLLDATALAEGFGHAGLQSDTFDCRSSWLYPGAGAWMVLPASPGSSDWETTRLTGMPLVFQQQEHWSHPAARIYTAQTLSAGAVAPAVEAWLAPSAWPPAQVLQEGVAITAPVTVGEVFNFLGYAVERDEAGLNLETYWRVGQRPGSAISLMAHLLDASGVPLAIADGLGVPLDSLQPGDILVQRHRLDYPAQISGGPYYVQTGVYWLDTLVRWSITGVGQPDSDRLLLPVILP